MKKIFFALAVLCVAFSSCKKVECVNCKSSKVCQTIYDKATSNGVTWDQFRDAQVKQGCTVTQE
jgi:hypothetical protein